MGKRSRTMKKILLLLFSLYLLSNCTIFRQKTRISKDEESNYRELKFEGIVLDENVKLKDVKKIRLNKRNLESLSISKSESPSKNISRDIFKMTNLFFLELDSNVIRDIPDNIGNLKNLEYIYLPNNKINTLSESFWKLVKLKEIGLSNNQLEYISYKIGNFRDLEVLDLSGNRLKSLPAEIGYLSKLKELDLSYNDSLEGLPIEIKALKNLTTLNIRNSKLALADIIKKGDTVFTFHEPITTIDTKKWVYSIPTNLVKSYGSFAPSSYYDEVRIRYPFYQPFMNLEYDIDGSKIRLIKPYSHKDYLFKANYHGMYIDADIIEYDFEEETFFIYNQNNQPAIFTSFDYFNLDTFEEMGTGLRFHPLKLIASHLEDKAVQKLQDISNDYYIIQDTTQSIALDELSRTYLIPLKELLSVYQPLSQKDYFTFSIDSLYLKPNFRFYHSINSYNLTLAAQKYGKAPFTPKDSVIYYQNDFTNIKIEAQGNQEDASPKAAITVENNAIALYNPKEIYVKENIEIKPVDSNLVKIYGGFNIFFNRFQATIGNLNFQGRNAYLMKDDFSFEIPEIEKILFTIEDTINFRKEIIENNISWGAGQIYLGNEINLAGLKQGKIPSSKSNLYYESYPILNIPDGGIVFFPSSHSAYDSSRVYASIPTVYRDSLDVKLLNPYITFNSNIFPKLDSIILRDYNNENTSYYGFEHTFKNDIAIYPNAIEGAIFKSNGIIKMIQQDGSYSFTADGEIHYKGIKIRSPEFQLFPDSLVVETCKIDWSESVFNAQNFEKGHLNWLVNDSIMIISNRRDIVNLEKTKESTNYSIFQQRYRDLLFTLFEENGNTITINGNLYHTDKDNILFAEGLFSTEDFSILTASDEPAALRPDDNKLTFSNTELRINSVKRDPYEYDLGYFYNEHKAVLLGNFVDITIDYTTDKVYIQPDVEFRDFASLEFPFFTLRTSAKMATWDRTQNIIEIKEDTAMYFTSTIHGLEDSNVENISFWATDALIDKDSMMVKISGVPSIYSMQSKVVLSDGRVRVKRDAEIEVISNATILLDTAFQYHQLEKARLRFKSTFKFEGVGFYKFTNQDNQIQELRFDKFQLIENQIKKDKSKRSLTTIMAQASISEEDKIYLSDDVQFRGTAIIYGNQPILYFEGFVKFSDDADWYSFNGNSDTMNEVVNSILKTKKNR